MNRQTFRSIVNPKQQDIRLGYEAPVVLIGSCFVENMAQQFRLAGIRHVANPSGIVYNPVSIARVLDDCMSNRIYQQSDLHQLHDRYISWVHHGLFSDSNPDRLLARMNASNERASSALAAASHLLLTLGTSNVYRLNGAVVANCHKVPNAQFESEFLDVSEIVEVLQGTLNRLKTFNPSIQVIVTVSPVRHLKDGAVENQRSKSRLLLACEQLCKQVGWLSYFPAYEIMMDDLRDYRFYGEDLVHPSPVAQKYIWEQFAEVTFDENTRSKMSEIAKFKSSLNHKIMTEDLIQKQAYLDNRVKALQAIEKKFPDVDFSAELSAISNSH